MTGKLLGNRYELLEIVGVGGMAIVYKAKDKLLNRYVAVKVLKDEFNENQQFINKFKRESQAAASLSHNNIVNVFDVGVEENHHYIVMEYVKGKTLKEYIKEKGKLPWKEALYLTKQIAFALEHAHKNKIIHRDIKPHNILLNEDMIPKVTDFGIARAISSATVTLVEETMGSVHYISPEQARGGFVDEKSDLYSLGVVLYEMLTGKVPFDSDNSVSVAIKHIQEDIKFPENEDVPPGLIDIFYKLVKKNPNDRYKTGRDLIKDLILVQNNPSARIKDETPAVPDETRKTPVIDKDQLRKQPVVNKVQDKQEKTMFSKKLIIALIIASVLLGAIAFGITQFFKVDEVKVPDVVGKNQEEAISIIEGSGLGYRIVRENNSEVEIDHVIKQDPVAGTIIKEGQIVTITISDGPKEIELPNVIDKYEVEGITALENMGFVVTEVTREYKDDFEEGKIYDQNPSPGTKLQIGSEVKLYVSKGKNTVVLDNLIGKSLDEAKNFLTSNNLVVGDIKEEASEDYDANIVIGQEPKAGREVPKNSVVYLTVSKGLVKSKTITLDLSEYTGYTPYEDGTGEENEGEVEKKPKKVNVKIYLINEDNVSKLSYEKKHYENEVISVTLRGTGVLSYQVQIDNQMFNPEIINF